MMDGSDGSDAWASLTAPDLRHKHPLSDIDLSMAREYVSLILVFDFPDNADTVVRDAVARIRNGLHVALRRFPFLAGHLGPDPSRPNAVQVRYPEDDAIRVGHDVFTWSTCQPCHTFQALSAKGMPGTYLTALGRANPGRESGNEPERDWLPAFKLHATFIDSGGLLLEFEFQHNLVDGTSMHLFIKTFATATRGEVSLEENTSYKAPDLTGLYSIPAAARSDRFIEWDFDETRSVPANSPHTINRIFTFSASVIRVLKQDIDRHIRFGQWGEWVSTTDCVSAIIWSAVLAARSPRLSIDTSVKLATAVGLRSKLTPPLPSPYFGNMAIVAVAETTVGELLSIRQRPADGTLPKLYSGSIATAALHIRRAVSAVDADYGKQRLLHLSQLDDPQKARIASARSLKLPDTGLRIGSLATFGTGLNFHIPGIGPDGKPRYIRKPRVGAEGNAIILPRQNGTKGDADWEVLISLSRPDMMGLIELLEPWCAKISQEEDVS